MQAAVLEQFRKLEQLEKKVDIIDGWEPTSRFTPAITNAVVHLQHKKTSINDNDTFKLLHGCTQDEHQRILRCSHEDVKTVCKLLLDNCVVTEERAGRSLLVCTFVLMLLLDGLDVDTIGETTRNTFTDRAIHIPAFHDLIDALGVCARPHILGSSLCDSFYQEVSARTGSDLRSRLLSLAVEVSKACSCSSAPYLCALIALAFKLPSHGVVISWNQLLTHLSWRSMNTEQQDDQAAFFQAILQWKTTIAGDFDDSILVQCLSQLYPAERKKCRVTVEAVDAILTLADTSNIHQSAEIWPMITRHLSDAVVRCNPPHLQSECLIKLLACPQVHFLRYHVEVQNVTKKVMLSLSRQASKGSNSFLAMLERLSTLCPSSSSGPQVVWSDFGQLQPLLAKAFVQYWTGKTGQNIPSTWITDMCSECKKLSNAKAVDFTGEANREKKVQGEDKKSQEPVALLCCYELAAKALISQERLRSPPVRGHTSTPDSDAALMDFLHEHKQDERIKKRLKNSIAMGVFLGAKRPFDYLLRMIEASKWLSSHSLDDVEEAKALLEEVCLRLRIFDKVCLERAAATHVLRKAITCLKSFQEHRLDYRERNMAGIVWQAFLRQMHDKLCNIGQDETDRRIPLQQLDCLNSQQVPGIEKVETSGKLAAPFYLQILRAMVGENPEPGRANMEYFKGLLTIPGFQILPILQVCQTAYQSQHASACFNIQHFKEVRDQFAGLQRNLSEGNYSQLDFKLISGEEDQSAEMIHHNLGKLKQIFQALELPGIDVSGLSSCKFFHAEVEKFCRMIRWLNEQDVHEYRANCERLEAIAAPTKLEKATYRELETLIGQCQEDLGRKLSTMIIADDCPVSASAAAYINYFTNPKSLSKLFLHFVQITAAEDDRLEAGGGSSWETRIKQLLQCVHRKFMQLVTGHLQVKSVRDLFAKLGGLSAGKEVKIVHAFGPYTDVCLGDQPTSAQVIVDALEFFDIAQRSAAACHSVKKFHLVAEDDVDFKRFQQLKTDVSGDVEVLAFFQRFRDLLNVFNETGVKHAEVVLEFLSSLDRYEKVMAFFKWNNLYSEDKVLAFQTTIAERLRILIVDKSSMDADLLDSFRKSHELLKPVFLCQRSSFRKLLESLVNCDLQTNARHLSFLEDHMVRLDELWVKAVGDTAQVTLQDVKDLTKRGYAMLRLERMACNASTRHLQYHTGPNENVEERPENGSQNLVILSEEDLRDFSSRIEYLRSLQKEDPNFYQSNKDIEDTANNFRDVLQFVELIWQDASTLEEIGHPDFQCCEFAIRLTMDTVQQVHKVFKSIKEKWQAEMDNALDKCKLMQLLSREDVSALVMLLNHHPHARDLASQPIPSPIQSSEGMQPLHMLDPGFRAIRSVIHRRGRVPPEQATPCSLLRRPCGYAMLYLCNIDISDDNYLPRLARSLIACYLALLKRMVLSDSSSQVHVHFESIEMLCEDTDQLKPSTILEILRNQLHEVCDSSMLECQRRKPGRQVVLHLKEPNGMGMPMETCALLATLQVFLKCHTLLFHSQVLFCSEDTTERELDLFFKRVETFHWLTFVLVGVDNLPVQRRNQGSDYQLRFHEDPDGKHADVFYICWTDAAVAHWSHFTAAEPEEVLLSPSTVDEVREGLGKIWDDRQQPVKSVRSVVGRVGDGKSYLHEQSSEGEHSRAQENYLIAQHGGLQPGGQGVGCHSSAHDRLCLLQDFRLQRRK